MEQKVIDLKARIDENFKDRDRDQSYKFISALAIAYPEDVDVLTKYNIKLRQSSQYIVLTIEPAELERQLKLAEEMGFIAAYQQNPKRITQPIEMVIKRMAKCDAIGVTYRNENGVYASFIFSQRAYEYSLGKYMTENKIPENNVIDFPTPSDTPNEASVDIDVVKENALHLLESVGMESEKDKIYDRLDAIADKGLGQKEMLMEACKILGGNTSFLVAKVDELLLASDNEKRGRAA